MRISDRFIQQSKPALFVEFLVVVLLIAFADYLTGYEVSVGVFYTVPVILAVWFCGKWPGLIMAVLTIAVRHGVDLANRHPFPHPWVHAWNDGIRFANLLLILYGTVAAKFQIEAGRNQIKSLQGILPICTSCKRIRGKDGYWTEIDSYLRAHSLGEPSPKLCPECSMRHFAENKILPGMAG